MRIQDELLENTVCTIQLQRDTIADLTRKRTGLLDQHAADLQTIAALHATIDRLRLRLDHVQANAAEDAWRLDWLQKHIPIMAARSAMEAAEHFKPGPVRNDGKAW